MKALLPGWISYARVARAPSGVRHDDKFALVIVTVVGARPNFMKAAPIHQAFREAGVDHEIVHTGQHYDEGMSKVFFQDLGMPQPIIDLEVGSGTHAEQTAAVMIGVERFFLLSSKLRV